MANSGNPVFERFTEKNWVIVAELEQVAKQLNRSMAQVALNWVVNRPMVSSVIIGATKLHQLQDNLGALDFEIPTELQQKLDKVSHPEVRSPYTFFESSSQMQMRIHDGVTVGDKPLSYSLGTLVKGS